MPGAGRNDSVGVWNKCTGHATALEPAALEPVARRLGRTIDQIPAVREIIGGNRKRTQRRHDNKPGGAGKSFYVERQLVRNQ